MFLSEFLDSEHKEQPFAAVLGHPVAHSRSPGIHNAALAYHKMDVQYHALDCPPAELNLTTELFALRGFRGANVTIPLKEKILSFLDEVDETAQQIGAVNTVVPDKQKGCLTGFNTDAYGFVQPLKDIGEIRTATILGTGGASRAVSYALLKLGIKTRYIVSRSSNKLDINNNDSEGLHWITYDNLKTAIRKSDLIVNTTPVGMHPDTGHSPVPDDLMPLFAGKVCYDIIYNPLETALLQKARHHGAQTIGGLDMFIHQAALSFELWFVKPMPLQLIRDVLLEMISKSNR